MRSSIVFASVFIALFWLFIAPTQAQIVNADFESWTDDNPDSWVIVETVANQVRENAFAYSGSSSAQMYCESYAKPRLVQYFAVDPGESVEASMQVYDNDASYTRLNCKVYDSDGGLLLSAFSTSYNSASWQALSIELVTPALASEVKYEIIFFYDTGTPGTQTNYLDLAAILIATPTFPNMQNGDFESWSTGDPVNWTLDEDDEEIDEETVEVYAGSSSMSMTCTSYTRPKCFQFLSVHPGDTVTGRVQVLDDDPSLVRLYLKAYDSDLNLLLSSFDQATNNAAWQSVEASLVTPSNTSFVRFELIHFWNSASPGTQTVYIDEAAYEIETYTYDVSAENTWQFIGVPINIDDQEDRNADELFSDDLGGASSPSTWVMSRWNNVTQNYDRFGLGDNDLGTEPPDIEPGLGYWFVQDVEPGVPDPWLDVTSSQTTNGAPASDVTQTIVGQTGGENGVTMLANPFYGDANLSLVTLNAEGNPSDWGSDGINSNIYTWDGSQYLIQLAVSAKLEMWEGFLIVKTTTGDGDITFPYDADEHGPVIDDVDEEFDRGWGLQLCVETLDGEYLDTFNELGVRDLSSDGYDSYDAFELSPPSSRYVNLAFTHDDWAEGSRFAHDYRDRDFALDHWDFEIKARKLQNNTLRLYWPTLPGVPDNIEFELWRIEPTHRERIGLLSDFDGYEFTVGGDVVETAHFRIMVQDNNVLADVDEDGSMIPTEFGIHSAYPNPFNAQVTIKMGLPVAGDAQISVFDILGREVATLHSGQMIAGEHTFTWNAESRASGIYFLRLSSDGQVSHRKVTLLQ
jgi:Secretion system C-terminal sorting domain